MDIVNSTDSLLNSSKPQLSKNALQQEPEVDSSLFNEAQNLYHDAVKLLQEIEAMQTKFSKVDGMDKFKRRVLREIEFLSGLLKEPNSIKKSHVTCTNLHHFRAIFDTFLSQEDVIAICKVFNLTKPDTMKKIEVDVVSKGGLCWIKVKAMKAETLHNIAVGDTSYGKKGITQLASDLIECAKQHLHHFHVPIVIIVFKNGVTEDVAHELKDLGVIVQGSIVASNSEENVEISASHTEEILPELQQIIPTCRTPNVVNLDISSLITLVSDLTNGGTTYNFKDPILRQQAEAERLSPTLPRLHEYMRDKEVVVTQTALNKFQNIIKIVGGEKEQKRSQELLSRLNVIPDQPSLRVKTLRVSSKIKEQHKLIFGTGDQIQATTMTSNRAVVAAFAQLGIALSVFLHPAHVLTEKKALMTVNFKKDDKSSDDDNNNNNVSNNNSCNKTLQ